MTNTQYRVVASVFNYLTVGFVLAGCVEYFFFGHSYQRAQMWIIAALITLFMAAISFRMGRREGGLADTIEAKPMRAELEPRWPYYFVALCIIVAVLDSFTRLWESRGIQVVIAIFLVLGLAKILFDRRIGRQAQRTPNASQRLVLWLGVIIVLIEFYRFVEI